MLLNDKVKIGEWYQLPPAISGSGKDIFFRRDNFMSLI